MRDTSSPHQEEPSPKSGFDQPSLASQASARQATLTACGEASEGCRAATSVTSANRRCLPVLRPPCAVSWAPLFSISRAYPYRRADRCLRTSAHGGSVCRRSAGTIQADRIVRAAPNPSVRLSTARTSRSPSSELPGRVCATASPSRPIWTAIFATHFRFPPCSGGEEKIDSRSRDAVAPELCDATKKNPPRNGEGRRSAGRRVQPWPHRRMRLRALRKRARLSALHRGARRSCYPSAQPRAALPGITGCKREDPPRRQCSEHLAGRS